MKNPFVFSPQNRLRTGRPRLFGRGMAAWAILAAAALTAGMCRAQDMLSENFGKAGFSLPALSESDDVGITADYMGADNATGTVSLIGNVRIVFGDITMSSDRASYHAESGDVHAEGNVRFDSGTGVTWQGEAIDFNHRTGEGLIGTGILKAGLFTVLSDVMVRDEMGVNHAHNATVTTCTNDMDSWHWCVTGDARYKEQEFIELKDGSGKLFGLPLLWMPYFYRDLNTHYGWRIMPGYSSKWGAYLKTAYVYPIAGTAESEASLYGKTALDLRSEYGVGVGQELTWRTDALNQWGRLSVYYANHQEDQKAEDVNWNSSYDEHRWSVGLTERLEFSPRDTFTLTGELLSDSQFLSDYKELSLRASSQPQAIANYEHRENGWVASVAAAGPLRSFYAGTQRLPEVRFDILPKPLLGIEKLYYESQNSVGYFRRQPAKYDGVLLEPFRYQVGNWAYYDTFRLDTRHMVRRPFELAEGITLTPRAGWRGTYWGDSAGDGSLFRSLFEFGARLQARYWKDYDSVRHTFIPYIDFTYASDALEDAKDQPYAFDRTDRFYEWRDRYGGDGTGLTQGYTGTRFGLKNILRRRTLLGFEDLLDFDLYGVWVFDSQDNWVRWEGREQPGRNPSWTGQYAPERVHEEDGLRVIGLNGSFSPTKAFTVATDYQYDPEYSRTAFWDINLRLRLKKLTVYTGYLYRKHMLYDYYWADLVRSDVLYGGFIHTLTDTVDWSLYARWNIEESDMEEVGGFVQYNLDCISLRLLTAYLPSYDSADGYKHDSDFRVSFSAWLRALPEEEPQDWMTWGNIRTDY